MKKVIVVFFLGLEFDAEWFFSRLKKKLKVEKIESIRLNPESLIADQVDAYYQAKHRLDCLLEKNSKQKNPEQFFVLALGERITDERIWEIVKNYPETATMIYPDKNRLIKVTGIREGYFVGEEVVFPKKEEKINSPEHEKEIEKAKVGFQKICESAPEIIGPPKKFM